MTPQHTFRLLPLCLALATPASYAACGVPGATLVSQVQGSAAATTMANQTVTIEGVVTTVMTGSDQVKGFYLQEEAADQDGNPATSEGIFVYTNALKPAITVGDVVRVTGLVKEFNGETQLQQTANLGLIESCGSKATATAVKVRLPVSSQSSWEALEGMLVQLDQPVYVVANYDFARYGELTLSSQPRLWTATQKHRPGTPEGVALAAANLLDKITLDDGYSNQNRNAWLPGPGGLSASNTLRAGDQLNSVSGVVGYSFNKYRLHPAATPQVVASNLRPAAPARSTDSVRLASFNVLNFFNGDGTSSDLPFKDASNRGAKTYADFLKQRAKIVSAIRALDADIVGLMELENDGFGAQSALQDLVNALNDGQPAAKHYSFGLPGMDKIGSDAIRVGLIYRAAVVKPAANPEVKEIGDPSRNRPALAQSFYLSSQPIGQPLTVVVNHLKSKSSACAGDADLADGQGNCNQTRVTAVNDLKTWLAGQQGGLGRSIVLVGDFNAYAKEDPIYQLEQAGFTNLLAKNHADGVYSYVFNGESGNLDHGLATAAASARVLGAGEWHINADEPTALEYSSEYKSVTQQQNYYAADAYRSSDHDPLYIDLRAEKPAAATGTTTSTASTASDKDSRLSKLAAADGSLLGLLAALGLGAMLRRKRG